MVSRKIVVGVLALSLVAILDTQDYIPWLTDTVVGIVLSSLFLTPLSKMISGERLVKASLISLAIGIVIFYWYMQTYLNGDLIEAIVFLAQWIATFCFISVIFQTFFTEFRKEISRL